MFKPALVLRQLLCCAELESKSLLHGFTSCGSSDISHSPHLRPASSPLYLTASCWLVAYRCLNAHLSSTSLIQTVDKLHVHWVSLSVGRFLPEDCYLGQQGDNKMEDHKSSWHSSKHEEEEHYEDHYEDDWEQVNSWPHITPIMLCFDYLIVCDATQCVCSESFVTLN